MSEVFWQGEQWRVSADGMEDLDDFQPTEFAPGDLHGSDPKSALPTHMAGKRGILFDEFIKAYLIACIVHRIEVPNIGAIISYAYEVRRLSGLPMNDRKG